jgi:3-oxoacyl-[acyl-carrier protein] reductase
MDLTTKVALVTGASRGIGEATALAMAELGADVCVNYATHSPGAEEVARSVREMGRRAISIQADVAKPEDVTRLVDETLREFGQIDILVNNAGITQPEPVFHTSKEKWDRMIAVNLTSAFLCCKAVLDHMVSRRQGSIINVSSICGKTGELGAGVHYCAAKAGLLGLTKALADQLGPYGIRVNAIAPAMIETRMIKWRPRELMQATIEKIPLNRLGTIQEAAALIAYLASDDAGFITGSVVDLNGGMYMD